MVRLIMGANGAGKTKQLIDLIHSAVESENGSVVCIEPGADMTFDIKSSVRLVNGKEYNLNSFECLRGFISGLYAGNYDITHIFIDSLTKIVGGDCDNETEKFLDWLNNFGEKHNIKFTITISDDESLASDGIKKYF